LTIKEKELQYLSITTNIPHLLAELNPEGKTKWNKGDSVILKYASFCKGVYETRTLNALLTALEDIVNATPAQK